MATYDRKNVLEFMDNIKGAGDLDLVRIWVACAFRPEGPYRSDMARVIDEFYELPIWEQQGVLFEMAPLVSKAATDAAQSRARAARTTDPL